MVFCAGVIAALREDCLSLHVETGRYRTPKTSYHLRTCALCLSNAVETELHFIIKLCCVHDDVFWCDTMVCHIIYGVSLASFPGPAQLSVAWSTEKRFFVRTWGEPGNEASICMMFHNVYNVSWCFCIMASYCVSLFIMSLNHT